MSERHGAGHGLTDHELSEIRMLIEERTGIHFDESRERFLSTRVREHMHERGYTRVSELLRAVRKTNVEYDSLLERMLTQETSFFRYPAAQKQKGTPRRITGSDKAPQCSKAPATRYCGLLHLWLTG